MALWVNNLKKPFSGSNDVSRYKFLVAGQKLVREQFCNNQAKAHFPRCVSFVPSLNSGPAGCSKIVKAAPKTAVSPSPLKSDSCLGGISLSPVLLIPHPHRLAFASRDLPWGVFCPGNTKLFSFLEIR